MFKRSLMLFVVVVSFSGLLSACAEFKKAGKSIGNAGKEVGVAIGHGSRDAAKAVAEETGKAADSVAESVKDDE